MANGLDKLEKFFSKRKASTVSTESSIATSSMPSSPTQPTMDLSFPSPSFIRPKTSRMAAREEFRMKSPVGNSPASPDGPMPGRNRSINSSGSTSSAASRRLRGHRPRSSSLDSVKRDELASVFRGFEFPKPPPSRHEDAPSSDYASKQLPSLPASRPISPFKMGPPLARLSTPPSSDPEDLPLSDRRPKAKKLQIFPNKSPPTPESSPDIGPVSDWQLRDNKPGDLLNDNLYKDTQSHMSRATTDTRCASSHSESKFTATMPSSSEPLSETSLSEGSLHEPDFDEFLSLSDDNVAESDIQDVEATPTISSIPLRDPPLLTLGPPCGSRAAKAAAFEAARIASRYNFDMIYVVNLWPEDSMAGHMSRDDPSSSLKAMTGRLLAAYGLHNVPSPFQIAAEVHLKVLRSEGWLEYRDEQALGRDFGRAYACSFYPGKYEEKRMSRSSRLSASSPKSPKFKDTSVVDRGIVFAAYRKPRADGSIQFSTPKELASLRRDVEAMVEMLIDIHVANRLRQPPILTRFSDETGPIPATSQVMCA